MKNSVDKYLEGKYLEGHTLFVDKYFRVIREDIKEGRKTPVFRILDNDDEEIGVIKWYGSWRKYCFFPNGETLWDSNCLTSITYLLVKLNQK